jgi:ferritin
MSKQEHKLLSTKCVEQLTYRINQEEFSSRLYEAMSLWLNNTGYLNAGKLWDKYSKEELVHAGWAKTFLLSFGITPDLQTIEAPEMEYEDLAQIIELSYGHEIDIAVQCTALAKCAMEEGNMMLFSLAQRYTAEQVEELDKLQTLKDQLATFGTDKIALRLLDHEIEAYL